MDYIKGSLIKDCGYIKYKILHQANVLLSLLNRFQLDISDMFLIN